MAGFFMHIDPRIQPVSGWGEYLSSAGAGRVCELNGTSL